MLRDLQRVIYFDAMARGVAYMASLSLEANVVHDRHGHEMPLSVVADASQHCMSSMLTPSGAAT
jgi:hypothetical protein